MDYAKESLRLHGEWGGKIEVICKVPCETKDELELSSFTAIYHEKFLTYVHYL